MTDFNRIITLLRKEKGVTQKEAAASLGVSQALLSHYEKGIRECGLDFVVRLANYYDVSCDYLLGRSPDRSGLTLRAEDLPDGDARGDTHYKGSVLPTLNKKIITGSLNILFDKLNACRSKEVVGEISAFLMLAVYRMFRLVYGAAPQNTDRLFSCPASLYAGYAAGSMNRAEANAGALLSGEGVEEMEPVRDPGAFAMTSETLARQYPLYITSLVNLIKISEERLKNDR